MADARQNALQVVSQTLNHKATFAQLIGLLPVPEARKESEAKRLIAQVINAIARTPNLQRCTPKSIAQVMLQAAELGLELSGPMGEAFMIPYKTEATFQLGYKGVKELAFRSGHISTFPAYIVYENDIFEYQLGDSPSIIHKPVLKDPGKPIAAYAVIHFKDGGKDMEVWPWEKIMAHADKYSKSFGHASSPWQTAPESMAKKTVMLQVGKRAPMAPDLNRAIAVDEYAGHGQILPELSNVALTTQARIAALKQTLNKPEEEELDEFGNPIFLPENSEPLVQTEPGELG